MSLACCYHCRRLLVGLWLRPAQPESRLFPTLPVSHRSTSSDSGQQTPDSVGEPWIPEYRPRLDEPADIQRARLLYQSRKRGMLENGLVLSTFAGRYLATMTATQLNTYDRLINQPSNDWDIYYWATGVRDVPAEFDTDVMALLKEFIQNKDRESRLSQPDL